MGILTARLPAAAAIAVFQSLRAAAEVKKSSGDPRTLNQLMADELYERLTGRLVVDGIDVEVGVVITDTALFAGTSDPAELVGYGPIPAELARELLRPVPEPSRESEDARSRPADQPPNLRSTLDQFAADPVQQARADAKANGNGYPGGHVPPGHCPDGPRCVSFSCTLIHGAPAPSPATNSVPELPTSWHGSFSGGPSPASGGPPPASGRSAASAGVRAATVWIRRLFTDPVTGVLSQRDPARLHRCTAGVPRRPGPHLSQRVVRGARPAHRPRHAPRRRWAHGRSQRSRALRPLQPGQGAPATLRADTQDLSTTTAPAADLPPCPGWAMSTRHRPTGHTTPDGTRHAGAGFGATDLPAQLQSSRYLVGIAGSPPESRRAPRGSSARALT